MAALLENCLLLALATTVVGACGWCGMYNLSGIGHVCIVLGRGNWIGILSCTALALNALVVGATLVGGWLGDTLGALSWLGCGWMGRLDRVP